MNGPSLSDLLRRLNGESSSNPPADAGSNPQADITRMDVRDIPKCGRFTAEERKAEYRRRGMSPSGVIDGVYNDTYLPPGEGYNDADRDWDADA